MVLGRILENSANRKGLKRVFLSACDFFHLSNCFTQFKIQSLEMFWFLTQEKCIQCYLNVEKATSSFNFIFLINL